MIDLRWQLVTCAGCGKSYVCTPEHDYNNATTASDGLCDTCLALNAGLHPDKTVALPIPPPDNAR